MLRYPEVRGKRKADRRRCGEPHLSLAAAPAALHDPRTCRGCLSRLLFIVVANYRRAPAGTLTGQSRQRPRGRHRTHRLKNTRYPILVQNTNRPPPSSSNIPHSVSATFAQPVSWRSFFLIIAPTTEFYPFPYQAPFPI